MIGGTATSVADDGYLNAMAPSADAEVIISNIYVPFGTTIEVYRYDGTNSILFLTASESILDVSFHCSYTNYIRIKNVSGSSAYISFDGMVVYE